ncbi:Putative CID domain-containing protein [Septoria linicola]|uniref:CID domain-containing protein n=1 Tax=Septoria linicola TaxID=215465 RepID=A0A9Q9ATF2_9PEZI|nr:Putative CID domain-containing protein [Septoria linicola]
MAYNDDAVKAKLTSLNESQDSIVTVAQWIMFHRRHAAQTAKLWLNSLQESPSANRRLNLLYLANEVVQQSRARGKLDFKVAFEPLIADATALAYKGANQDIQGKVRRVIEVWRQRNIFDAPTQHGIEKKLEEVDKTKGSSKLGGGSGRLGGSLFGGGSSGGVAPELEAINKTQAALSKAESATKGPIASANAKYNETIDPATPVPSAPVRAAKLRGLVKDLMAAQNAVEASMNSRRELVAGLEKLIATNRAQIAQEESTSRDLGAKIDSMEATIRDVEDSIMRGVDPSPVNGNGIEPERPETEGFTPPPPEVESFTPPGGPSDGDQIIGEIEPLEQPFSNPTGADPIHEQPPNLTEPPPEYVPPSAMPAVDDAATQAQAFLANLSSLKGTIRTPSGELPAASSAGNLGDPRLKRRKMSHRASTDVDDEIFGAGMNGVDEDGISAMLGQ